MNGSLPPVVELLTIGREILDGRVVDTNSVKMAELLRPLGLIPRFGQRVDDELGRMVDALRLAGSRSTVILVTGGLGPTSDDRTAEAVAAFLGEELRLNEEALSQIEERLKRFSRPMIDAQRKQAMLPPSCIVLPNPEGTAPGFALERDGRQWFFLPGVPREMLRMMRERVLPRLPRRPGYRTRTWVTQFTAESLLQKRLGAVEARLPEGFEITYQTRFPENHVGLCADCGTPELDTAFEALAAEIDSVLGADVFSRAASVGELLSLEEVVAAALRERRERVYVVEELSGGLISQRLSAIEGSVGFFAGGTVLPEAPEGAPGLDEPRRAEELARAALERADERTWVVASAGDCRAARASVAVASPDGTVISEPALTKIGTDRTRYRVFVAQKALELLRVQIGAKIGRS